MFQTTAPAKDFFATMENVYLRHKCVIDAMIATTSVMNNTVVSTEYLIHSRVVSTEYLIRSHQLGS